ncbi:MAG TPA: hypothetical protein P5125_08970, partial [Kiritimatiellia bacterium]|nr:hypothetical protein [Kiritimatiellia bacterium]
SSSPWFLCTTPNEPVTVRSAEEAAELVRAAEQKSGEETARIEAVLPLDEPIREWIRTPPPAMS